MEATRRVGTRRVPQKLDPIGFGRDAPERPRIVRNLMLVVRHDQSQASHRHPPVRAAALVLLVGLLACGTLNVSEEMRLGRDVHYDLRQELHFLNDEITVDYVRDIGESILHCI